MVRITSEACRELGVQLKLEEACIQLYIHRLCLLQSDPGRYCGLERGTEPSRERMIREGRARLVSNVFPLAVCLQLD